MSGANAQPDRGSTFYQDALAVLLQSRRPFLIGGAYALERYTGIARDTKDLDVFLHPRDLDAVLAPFAEAGYRTEVTFAHWLGKVHAEGEVLDLIFSSGNGVARVDDAWFTHAPQATVLGVPVRLTPVEEMIWSKAFIMERERYDGADVAHLLRARAATLDWTRLLHRFEDHWRVLLSHLVLFGFIYPAERACVPDWAMAELIERLALETLAPGRPLEAVCQGTLVSRAQYLVDVEAWGYQDARLHPRGRMTAEDIARWTAAIDESLRPRS